MTHIRTLTRPLVAALAILALAAPPTLAGPGEPGGVDAAAGSQELARLKAGFGTPSWAGSTPASPTDDTPAGETGPVYWSYDYEAPAPEAARSLNADDGGPGGTAVAAGLTGACLLLGAAAAMAGRIRLRARRGRIAA